MADEARLHELLDLVEQARSEGDKDTEAKATAAYKRESAPQPFPDVYGGAGGYNPVQGLVTNTALTLGGKLGVTPENSANPIANAFGPAEMAAHLATGGVGQIAGGLAGIGQGAWNLVTPKSMNGTDAADRLAQVSNALTYEPRTGAGAGMTKVVGAPGELYGKGTNYLGEKTTDITGSPLAGAVIKTAGDIAPALLSDGSLKSSRAKGTAKYVPEKDAVPTTEQLNAASNALYKAADDAGVVIRPESTAKAAAMIQKVADAENLGKLTPKLKEAHDVLVERATSGKPMSLKDADKARGLINDAAQSQDAGDRRLASIVKRGYDDYLNGLGATDTLAGDPAQGVALLKDARSMWGRKSYSETLDAIQRNAEIDGETKYTQAGLEHALRNEFKKLYKSDDAQRYMTPEQLAAVRKVAAPGAGANALRNLGKMDPTRGGMAAALNNIVGGGLGVAAGGLVGGLPGAAAGGLIGKATLGTGASMANMAALRGTVKRVAAAREALVGRGIQPNGGLLSKESPTPLTAGPQGLLADTAAPEKASTRSPAQIRAEIQRLSDRARFELAGEDASSPKVVAALDELRALQRELAATEANRRP